MRAKNSYMDYLLDGVAKEYAEKLNDTLHIGQFYGRAERLVRLNADGKKIYTPTYFDEGKGCYIELIPDDSRFLYGFFYAGDPQEVEYTDNVAFTVTSPMSFIVWFNMAELGNGRGFRPRDYIKALFLDLFNGRLGIRSGRFTIKKVYELAENIWRGFSYDEIDNQFLMQPYCGYRFEGEMTASQNCHIEL